MGVFRNTSTGDVVSVPPALDAKYEARPDQEPYVDSAELKGQQLDDALRGAGLPVSGSAADKRARLSEHQNKGDNDA